LQFFKNIIPGLFLVLIVTFFSIFLSEFLYIDSILISIFLGVFINNFFNLNQVYNKGINFSEKHLLNFAIILMGVNFNNSIVKEVDSIILYNVFLFVIVGFFITLLICKLFNLPSKLSQLLAFGNAICGSSAIIAVSSIVRSKKEDVILSVSIINIIGSLSIIIVPFILYFFSINNSFMQGQIIGGTIQAVGQVSATGYIINENVGQAAILIKMSRILFLIPALITFSFIYSFNKKSDFFQFPFFIIGFIIVFFLSYNNLIPDVFIKYFKILSKYFLLFAITALGLKVSIQTYLKSGIKVFLVCLLAFLIQVFIVVQIVT
tara:strand:- start:1102 stop:2061 length:960 start_codon:yes stop_codon:yes gene_type:complete